MKICPNCQRAQNSKDGKAGPCFCYELRNINLKAVPLKDLKPRKLPVKITKSRALALLRDIETRAVHHPSRTIPIRPIEKITKLIMANPRTSFQTTEVVWWLYSHAVRYQR